MKVLIACEFSGVVRDAFIAKGHDAMSCDLLPTEKPGPHYQGDVMDIINDGWDLMIAHPPCTYLSYAATRSWNYPGREALRLEALDFFMVFINSNIEKVCVENPVGYPNTVYRKPDQIIHPYYFGDPVKKRTCLWLKNLPLLQWDKSATEPEPVYVQVGGRNNGKKIHYTESLPPTKDRSHIRSKTFQGIADAMAEQWG